jgi:hypothetical protein
MLLEVSELMVKPLEVLQRPACAGKARAKIRVEIRSARNMTGSCDRGRHGSAYFSP